MTWSWIIRNPTAIPARNNPEAQPTERGYPRGPWRFRAYTYSNLREPKTMNAIELIRHGLAISEKRAFGLMEDMKDSPMTCPTAKGGNHPLWTVGHCTFAESRIIESVAQGKPSAYAHW